jgi:DNA-binding protein H-NS
MQWWGAIGQQFQTIASQAVADMQKHANTFVADKATPASASPTSATKPRAARPRKTAPASNARPAAKSRSKPGKAKS